MSKKEIKSLTYKGYDVQNDKTYEPFLGKQKVVQDSAVALQLQIMSLKRAIKNDEKKLEDEIKKLLKEQNKKNFDGNNIEHYIKMVLTELIRVNAEAKDGFKGNAGLDEGLPTDQGAKIINNDNIVLIALQSALRGNTAYTFLKAGKVVGAHSGAISSNKGTRQQGPAHDVRRNIDDINKDTSPDEIINKFTAMYLESLATGELIESDENTDEHQKLSKRSKGSNKEYLSKYPAVNTLINENDLINIQKLGFDMHLRREIMKHRLTDFREQMNKVSADKPILRRRNSMPRLQALNDTDNAVESYAYNTTQVQSYNTDLSSIDASSDKRTITQKRADFLKLADGNTTNTTNTVITEVSLPNDTIADDELEVMSLAMNVAGYISQPMRMDLPELVEEYKKILSIVRESRILPRKRTRDEMEGNMSMTDNDNVDNEVPPAKRKPILEKEKEVDDVIMKDK